MFSLPPLPFAYDALEPTMSERTLHHHHDKHHAKYVDTLNTLLKDRPEAASATLEEVIAQAREARETKVFNNAAQAWNHGFFWECLSPEGGQPGGELAEAINASFETLEGLKKALTTEGVGHFGSGWAWLVRANGELKVISTHDAETAASRDDVIPLLVIDVWEHAYYLDFQQDREGFLKGVFDKLVNWDFVTRQFEAAKAGGKGAYRYPASIKQAA